MPSPSSPQYLPSQPGVYLSNPAVARNGASLEAIGLASILRARICLSPVAGVLAGRDGSPMTLDQVADDLGRDYNRELVRSLVESVPELLEIDPSGTISSPDLADRRKRTSSANGILGGRPRTAVSCSEKPKEPNFGNLNREPKMGPTSPVLPEIPRSNPVAVLLPEPSEPIPPPSIPPIPPSRALPSYSSPHLSSSSSLSMAEAPRPPQEHPSASGVGIREHRGNTAIEEHVRRPPAPFHGHPSQATAAIMESKKQELRPSGPNESILWMMKQEAAAICFAAWSAKQWMEALDHSRIQLWPGGPMATSAPASIIDWVYDMARDSWTDRRGRPVLDWPHCEAIARSWFQAWYGNEKRLKRDPWAQRTGCSHCQRPGSSHSDGNVKVFVDPRTNKPISKIDAAAMIGSGLDPLESPVRCPHCNPRPDGRHTAWLRENSFPAWTSGRQMIDVLSLVPGAVMP